MKLRRFAWLLLVVILALTMAACGGGGGDGDDGGVDLSQSYDNNGLSFNYPAGWVLDDSAEGQVTIANSQEAMEAIESSQADGGPSSGQFGLMIMSFSAQDMGLEEGVALSTVLDMLMNFMVGENGPDFSDPSEETIEGKDTVRVEGSDESVQAAIIVVNLENAFAFVTGAAAPDELSDFNDEINAIIGSISYSAP